MVVSKRLEKRRNQSLERSYRVRNGTHIFLKFKPAFFSWSLIPTAFSWYHLYIEDQGCVTPCWCITMPTETTELRHEYFSYDNSSQVWGLWYIRLPWKRNLRLILTWRCFIGEYFWKQLLGGVKEAGLGRGRSWATFRVTIPVPWGALALLQPLRLIPNWGSSWKQAAAPSPPHKGWDLRQGGSPSEGGLGWVRVIPG